MTHQTSLDGPYHATWMQSYALCGQKALQSILNPPSHTSLAQFKGSVVHRMLEVRGSGIVSALHYCNQKLDAPLNEQPDETFADECLRLYHSTLHREPTHHPLYAEYAWAEKIGGYQFVGTIDAIWEMPNGERWLIDYKTSKQLPSQFYLDNSLQFSIYAFACRAMGIKIDRIAWVHLRDWLPYVKNTTKANFATTNSLSEWAAIQDFEYTPAGKAKLPAGSLRGPGIHLTQRTDAQLDETEREVKRLIKGIKFNLFPRVMYDQICGMCGYKEQCRAGLEGSTNIKLTRQQKQLIEELDNE